MLIEKLVGVATVTGTEPLSFAWSKGGQAIAGATQQEFSIAAVSAGDAGDYVLTVTNLAGTATSAAATVGVFVPPSITTHPARSWRPPTYATSSRNLEPIDRDDMVQPAVPALMA